MSSMSSLIGSGSVTPTGPCSEESLPPPPDFLLDDTVQWESASADPDGKTPEAVDTTDDRNKFVEVM